METSVCDAGGSPSQFAAVREAQAQVLDALHRLPLDLQITLELHYWEEMSVAEIAVVLEIPPGTVKSRLHRARERLREVLMEGGASTTSVEESLGHLQGLRAALGPSEPPT
jgi:RNA polymerase sigma-70 factor (ECF subfamily)